MQTLTKPKVINRLNRIEGQVRGISRMVEDDRYCVDVLTQLQAVRAALLRVESEVLKDHLDHCVMGAMTGNDPAERKAKANELIELLGRASR
ncbi:metal-sensitive transcriptional regulator [Brevundimonas sp.]|uniref:metal-sensitive transcriptional regulator n=1 Tax=Brevundimonas sp. TaxID=1871086 RepID=UPI00181FF80A|nr:metal-sensitive transcriptional regulator [Brevundimonas sp.]MBA3051225.1 metal-sensitive transcriptional regulator [Brevundimonas sp.]